jgi:WD40 repeat protein
VAAASYDGRHVLAASIDGGVRLWDLSRSARPAPGVAQGGKVLGAAPGSVWCVAFSPDGKTALSAFGPDLKLWEVATGNEVRTFKGHTDRVTCAAFSKDGSRFVSGSYDKTARLWDTSTGREVAQFKGHDEAVKSVALALNASQVVTGAGADQGGTGTDYTVRLWDVNNQNELKRFQGHTGPVRGVAFFPDGRRIISAGLDRSVRVWDTAKGNEVASFKGHTGEVYSLALSADGRRALTASRDRTVRLWDTATGTELKRFTGHTSVVFSAAFSPDGRRVLSGSGGFDPPAPGGQPALDCSVRLWDVNSGKELTAFRGHTRGVLSVACAPDGRHFLSGGNDRTVRLWELPNDIPSVGNPPPGGEDREPVARVPVPDKGLVEKAEQALKKAYEKEYAKTAAADRLALAGDFLNKAAESKDPAERYVLLREARDLAVLAARAPLVVRAVDELHRYFTLSESALDMKLESLEEFKPASNGPLDNQYLAEAALSLTDEAVGADNYEAANRLMKLAGSAAQAKGSPPSLKSRVTAREREIKVLVKEYEGVKAAVAKLKEQPDDAEANLAVGKYICLWKGDWAKGLPLMAKGDDEKLQALAKKEMERPSEPLAQIALAEDWRKLAEDSKRGTALRARFQRRAYQWYKQAAPGLPERLRVDTERIIKDIEKKVPSVKNLETVGELTQFKDHKGKVLCVALSPDGSRAVSGGADGTLRLWDPKTGKQILQFQGLRGEITCVAFSPDGNAIAAGGTDNLVRIWNVEASGPMGTNGFPKAAIQCVAFSADGSRVYSGDADGSVWQWDWKTRGFGHRVNGKSGGSGGIVSLNAQARGLFYVSTDGMLRLRPESGKVPSPLTLAAGGILSVAFSPNGGYLVTGNADKSVRLWQRSDAGYGFRGVFSGHTNKVTAVAVGGGRVLSGGVDKTVRVWDVGTGRELHTYVGHADAITAVALSGDGRLAASASADGTVRVWTLPK